MKNITRLASRFIGSPLAIHPPKLEVIINTMAVNLGYHVELEKRVQATTDEREIKLNASYNDGAMDCNGYSIESGVAIIPVQGTLMKKLSGMSMYSGGCSYAGLQADIQDALDNRAVSSILLDIDSPGGETTGCFDLADFIYKSRSVKPIYAVANEAALSAAYAIASSAEKIFVTRTGAVGSIGVYALHGDQSGWDKMNGLKFTYIHAGDKKVDGNPHEPLSSRAEKDIQKEVDREYAMFTETVARNRGVSLTDVVATQAGLLWADSAIPLLADNLGTFSDAMAALVVLQGSPSKVAVSAATRPIKGEKDMETITNTAEDPQVALKGTAAEVNPAATGAAKADPADTTGEPDDDDKDTTDPEAKKKAEAAAKVAAAGAAAVLVAQDGRSSEDIQAISNLLKLSGRSEELGDFLMKKSGKGDQLMSVADISAALTETRVKNTGDNMINSQVDPTNSPNARNNFTRLEAEAINLARQNRTAVSGKLYVPGQRTGTTKEQAVATMLEEHPEVYESYRAQHNAKSMINALREAGIKLEGAF